MRLTSDRILTELVEIEGKGKEAWKTNFKFWLEDWNERLVMSSSDMDEWEARAWLVGPSISPRLSVAERANDCLLQEKLNDRIDFDKYVDYVEKFHKYVKEALIKLNPPVKKHASHDLGPREFTLTYSPDWFEDDVAAFQMKRAIDRLTSYYEQDLIYLKAVGERTKAGRVRTCNLIQF